MKFNNLFNFLWMQLIWFAAVLGAANKILWPLPVLLFIFILSVFNPKNRIKGDFQLVLVALLSGFILDTTWISLGWLEYADTDNITTLAPVWILILWASLALTINHSLAWLQPKPLLAATISGIASPLSYMVAAKLGAVRIVAEDNFWLFGIGASWAVTVPVLLWLGHYFQRLAQEANGNE
jgi:Protein of unknown function (DUF2878)